MLGFDNNQKYTILLDDVLAGLRKARAEHLAIVEAAQAGFRKAALKELRRIMADAKAGRVIRTSLGLAVPESRVADYDLAIALYDAVNRVPSPPGVLKTVELTADEFQRLIMNRWPWARQFATSNRAYVGEAGPELITSLDAMTKG